MKEKEKMEERGYSYFKRDLSWLSFNYRVLLEASDASLSIYDRIRFLSIYSSNLEEFYEIRVADHRGAIIKRRYASESNEELERELSEITLEVNRQQQFFYRTFHEGILPALRCCNVHLYQDHHALPFHVDFIRSYFNEEVFPFLSPVSIQSGIRTFIRDRRLYLVVRMYHNTTSEPYYVLIKIPYAKTPRFIPLPAHEGIAYYMFIDDIIRANLPHIFPGYRIDDCFSIKISRDADIYLEEESRESMLSSIRTKVEKRKIGALSRFMYDRAMPTDFLSFICTTFAIAEEDLVVGGRYMNLQDLSKLPQSMRKDTDTLISLPAPMRVPYLDRKSSVCSAVEERDVLLQFPYQSFDYLIRFLMEAAFDPAVVEIKITQYRVAENSAVINALISAAHNGKKVTVFVELKARFDEENNISTAADMERAGIKIIYSIPGLKVHAKVSVILRSAGHPNFAYLGTGNFNERTAKLYSDLALLTCNQSIVEDMDRVFALLEGSTEPPVFSHLLVSPFNMSDRITQLIRRESMYARSGQGGRIILKMNGLHDRHMIDELYMASESGVEIDLIVRGICCLIPGQSFSSRIRVTRIVDVYLEHARIWYFGAGGDEEVYLTSADWMNRNLNRRIETAVPILDKTIKRQIIDILGLQLRDNVKACFIDADLRNVFKRDLSVDFAMPVRAQEATYEYIQNLTTEEKEQGEAPQPSRRHAGLNSASPNKE